MANVLESVCARVCVGGWVCVCVWCVCGRGWVGTMIANMNVAIKQQILCGVVINNCHYIILYYCTLYLLVLLSDTRRY